MKYIGGNAIEELISLIKGDLNKKLDKNQGTANSGKILGVDVSGEVAPTDIEIATLVDIPNGLLKGDGTTISAAVAGTDYVLPSTLNSYAKKSEIPAADTPIPDATITSTWNSITI